VGPTRASRPSGALVPPSDGTSLDAQRRETEREAIRTALRRASDNRTVAARILGVSRRTLYNKLEEYGLS
jgi:two-component system response regulator AtoC